MLTCLYDVVGYALLRPMCLCVYFHAIWFDPCLHMLIFIFFHVYVLTFYMFACTFFYAYVSRSMFPHVCVLGSMLYMLYAIFHVLVCSMACLCD